MRFLATMTWLALALVTTPTIAGDFEDGSAALKRGDHATAFSKFKEAAEQGNPDAQISLGLMYRQGLGVTQDDKQAVSWYEKAAAQGNAIAQFNVGNAYSLGRGVKQDDKQAISWYEKAAAQGHASAQLNLGLGYYNGIGVTRDYKQAALWFEKAAVQGHAGAQNNLGMLYVQGQGVTQDKVEAHKWWALSGENGNKSARGNLEKVEREMTREQIAEAQRRASAPPKWPPNWVLVGGGNSPADFIFYADPSTISRTVDVVRMWSLYDYNVKQVSKVTGKSFQSVKGQNEYDCKDAKERRLSYSHHSARLGGGEVVFSTADLASSDQWDPVSPRSAAEQLWKIACGKQ